MNSKKMSNKNQLSFLKKINKLTQYWQSESRNRFLVKQYLS